MAKKYREGYREKRAADPSRLLAAQVLQQVEDQGAFANLVLPKVLRAEQRSNPNFTFRDAAFTSEMVYGTLRMRGYLDTILQKYTTRPLDELDSVVLQILRIGVYQLLFMRVPDHAGVAETVDVARQLTSDGPARMVNAVLRSITRTSPEEIAEIFAQISDEDERLGAELSHPQWIVRSFERALLERGRPREELRSALEANNTTPLVNLVARPGLVSAQELAEEVEDILGRTTSQGDLSEYAVIIGGGDPGALPSIRDGRAAVQDEGSQFAALLLAEAPLSGRDKLWLDLCAGPGGKSALLAALGAPRGARVVANEISAHRARLVERSVSALENVTVENLDGRTIPSPKEDGISGYDRVLVDAPCSGLGSLRRRPESRWTHRLEDLEEMVPLQQGLLQRGIEVTRRGGVLAWVTCTPQVEETIDLVEWALGGGNVELVDTNEVAEKLSVLEFPGGVPVDSSVGDKKRDSVRAKITRNSVQLWPHIHGTDAMFVALLRKI